MAGVEKGNDLEDCSYVSAMDCDGSSRSRMKLDTVQRAAPFETTFSRCLVIREIKTASPGG
jgi:hypothetical protein